MHLRGCTTMQIRRSLGNTVNRITDLIFSPYINCNPIIDSAGNPGVRQSVRRSLQHWNTHLVGLLASKLVSHSAIRISLVNHCCSISLPALESVHQSVIQHKLINQTVRQPLNQKGGHLDTHSAGKPLSQTVRQSLCHLYQPGQDSIQHTATN